MVLLSPSRPHSRGASASPLGAALLPLALAGVAIALLAIAERIGLSPGVSRPAAGGLLLAGLLATSLSAARWDMLQQTWLAEAGAQGRARSIPGALAGVLVAALVVMTPLRPTDGPTALALALIAAPLAAGLTAAFPLRSLHPAGGVRALHAPAMLLLGLGALGAAALGISAAAHVLSQGFGLSDAHAVIVAAALALLPGLLRSRGGAEAFATLAAALLGIVLLAVLAQTRTTLGGWPLPGLAPDETMAAIAAGRTAWDAGLSGPPALAAWAMLAPPLEAGATLSLALAAVLIVLLPAAAPGAPAEPASPRRGFVTATVAALVALALVVVGHYAVEAVGLALPAMPVARPLEEALELGRLQLLALCGQVVSDPEALRTACRAGVRDGAVIGPERLALRGTFLQQGLPVLLGWPAAVAAIAAIAMAGVGLAVAARGLAAVQGAIGEGLLGEALGAGQAGSVRRALGRLAALLAAVALVAGLLLWPAVISALRLPAVSLGGALLGAMTMAAALGVRGVSLWFATPAGLLLVASGLVLREGPEGPLAAMAVLPAALPLAMPAGVLAGLFTWLAVRPLRGGPPPTTT